MERLAEHPDSKGKIRSLRKNFSFYLFIFFLALAVHVFPLLLFKPLPEGSASSMENHRFSIMFSHPESDRNDPYGLNYWLKYGDPTLFLETDQPYSYSSLLKQLESRLEPARETPSVRALFLAENPENPFSAEKELTPRKPADFPMEPVPGIVVPSGMETLPDGQPALCSTSSGKMIRNLFTDPAAAFRVMKKNPPDRPTVIYILPSELPDLPPILRVASSSGNRELDLLASGALTVYAARKTPDELKRFKYVIVDWRTGSKGVVK